MSQASEHPHDLITTLPRAWETDDSFGDSLYEWMSRAPWLLISGALHFVLALILAAIPWSVFEEPEDNSFTASIDPPVEDLIEPEEEPVEDVIEPEEVDPILEDIEFVENPSESLVDPTSEPKGEKGSAESPFDSNLSQGITGIGGNAGSKMGGRFNGGGGPGRRGAPNVHIQKGLQWLADHQDDDGKWDCDEFFKHDPAGDQSSGPGHAGHDVGVTSMALLAFLGDGHTTRRGKHKDVVVAGMRWLLDQQNRETGLIGEPVGHSYVYDHAIATIALCEATTLDGSTILRRRAADAVHFITRARNPYRVWRYAVPPDGSNDTSVTGWMIFALRAAEEAGIPVDRNAYAAAIEWFDEMTDPATGRVGYVQAGSASSRIPGINEDFGTEGTEALTAVTLLCRFFLGQRPDDPASLMDRHAELLLRSLPEWSDDGRSNDMYYWYYGSYAMFQMGNRRGGAKKNYWNEWKKAMEPAVLGGQRADGSARGSWDPNGPWGPVGGRVYSTATMVLCLEVYYRYSRLLGAR